MQSGDGSPRPAAALFGLLDSALAVYAVLMAVSLLVPSSSDCDPSLCETTEAKILGVLAIPIAAVATAASVMCVRVISHHRPLWPAIRASGLALGFGVVWLIAVYSVLTALAIGH